MTAGALIAVVDDEEDIRGAVSTYLRLNGLDAVECSGARALNEAMSAREVDLVLLDVNMPDEDGFAIARRLRASSRIGIIMLTARADLIDRVVGLEIGADDYLAKPFELREVLARVRAVLRRSELRRDGPATTSRFDALWVQDRGVRIRVPVTEVCRISADRDYALLHTASRVHAVRVTMDDLQTQLDPALMLRIHRSRFVPAAAVRSFRRAGRGGEVLLDDGMKVAVGPAYVDDVRRALRLDAG